MIDAGQFASSSERRGHFRKTARPGRRLSLRFALTGDDDLTPETAQAAFTVNIGVGGAFVVTEDPLPPGSRLVLHFTVPPLGRRVAIHGEVRWIADGEEDELHGMGVKFHGLAGDELRALNEYFASLSSTLDHDEAR